MRQDVFEELLIADNKLLKEIENSDHNRAEILDAFAKRVSLYKEWADKQHDPIVKAIVDAKKSVIMSDIGLLAAQYDLQSVIAKIISRLDSLEEKVFVLQTENLHNYFVVLFLNFFNIFILSVFGHTVL